MRPTRFCAAAGALFLAWLPLQPVAAQAAGGGAPRNGTYHCVAAGGVAGTLKLVIKSPSEYADRNGKTGRYTHDPATGKLRFESGAWGGYFGKVLGPTKIGLSSRDGGYSGTVCDLK